MLGGFAAVVVLRLLRLVIRGLAALGVSGRYSRSIKMTVLIIADSRGRGLQLTVDKLMPEWHIRVLTHPGAGYEMPVLKSIAMIKTVKPMLVIVLAGICDLTWKHRETKVIGLRYDNVSDNLAHLTDSIKSAYDLLTTAGEFKISFATLTGLDLADVNNPKRRQMSPIEYQQYSAGPKITHPNQKALDSTILAVNKCIVTYNKRNGAKTVWLAGLVHAYIRGTHHHYYRRLSDGCHLDEKTKLAWATQIVKSIGRIL